MIWTSSLLDKHCDVSSPYPLHSHAYLADWSLPGLIVEAFIIQWKATGSSCYIAAKFSAVAAWLVAGSESTFAILAHAGAGKCIRMC